MDLRQYLENLKYDLGNGGLEEDSFAVVCYITMVNKAHRMLSSNTLDKQAIDDAKKYLTLCHESGCDSLRYVAS